MAQLTYNDHTRCWEGLNSFEQQITVNEEDFNEAKWAYLERLISPTGRNTNDYTPEEMAQAEAYAANADDWQSDEEAEDEEE